MRVLVFSYFYPPMGGGGVQRAAKFVKYLAAEKMELTVICADDDSVLADESLIQEIPSGVRVERVRHIPLQQRLLSASGRGGRNGSKPQATDKKPVGSPLVRILMRRLNHLLSLFQFPDEKTVWGRSAVVRAKILHKENPFQVVYSTSAPISAHRAACDFCQAFGVPWISDYRDLWTDNPGYPFGGLRRILDRQLESRLLESADRVVTVSPTLLSRLRERVSRPGKCLLIENGYDEEDFRLVPTERSSTGEIHIYHVGSLYGHQSPAALIIALREAGRQDPTILEPLVFKFIGRVSDEHRAALEDLQASLPCRMEFTGHVSHHEAVQALGKADILLLLIGGAEQAKGVYTGKLFEYLRAAKPILMFGDPGGDAAVLLRKTAHGLNYDDTGKALPEVIGDLRKLESRLSSTNPLIIRFERRHLAKKLAAAIREVSVESK